MKKTAVKTPRKFVVTINCDSKTEYKYLSVCLHNMLEDAILYGNTLFDSASVEVSKVEPKRRSK